MVKGKRPGVAVLIGLIIIQALVFTNPGAVSLTFLAGLGLGIWTRHWSAAAWTLGTFIIAFILAAVTGWLDPVRIWDLVLGAALVVLGGLIGGGIFQIVSHDAAAHDVDETAETAMESR